MKTSAAIAAAIALTIGTLTFACAAHARDGVVIRNTGSTNFSGYTIRLWSDGSASVVHSNRMGNAIGQASSTSVPTELTRKFFGDLKAAKTSGNLAGRACMKSASFGTTTIVQYHGWTSPDLECPGDGLVAALASEAHEVAAATGARALPVRRGLLPNEPRRVPEPSRQASPSPESSPSTP